ncbi:hypothetical protein F5Y04DRAFT_288476 [Hypomontagnella monticulosa]|nr:hypothetical protein F5Y04DRAFT_288476 [Hypomontagnella monticulosa]
MLALRSLLGWLKGRRIPRVEPDQPPKHEEIALGPSKEPSKEPKKEPNKDPSKDYYSEKAVALLTVYGWHNGPPVWFVSASNDQQAVAYKYLTAMAHGETLRAGSEKYVRETVDGFHLVMQWVDFLVDQLDLNHANGAKDCSSWKLEFAEWYTTSDKTNVRDLRDQLVRKSAAMFDAPLLNELRPYCYLATCVYETKFNQKHCDELLYKINLLDKRFILLRARYDCLEEGGLFGEEGSERFQFLLAETKRADHEFLDVLDQRELMKKHWNLSDSFLDELYGGLREKSGELDPESPSIKALSTSEPRSFKPRSFNFKRSNTASEESNSKNDHGFILI